MLVAWRTFLALCPVFSVGQRLLLSRGAFVSTDGAHLLVRGTPGAGFVGHFAPPVASFSEAPPDASATRAAHGRFPDVDGAVTGSHHDPGSGRAAAPGVSSGRRRLVKAR
jgi:hypothetical protein